MVEMHYEPGTALIVVDIQNDFADPRGNLAVPGGAGVVHAANIEIAEAGAAGATVVFTQDWHPGSTPHFAKDGGVWPVHCVGGTWGAEAPPALYFDGPVVRKGSHGEDGYSGFTMRDPIGGATMPTELDGLLRAARIERVVIVGLATDYCVKATALDARSLGYPTTVLRDAIAAVDLAPGDGARALEEMQAAGVTVE
jgi:nicotinamidase/pyrazinamidase